MSSPAIELRRETVAARDGARARLLFASDLHLGWPWTRAVGDEILEHLRIEPIDALLLGGDLCDGQRALPLLTRFVRQASELARVLVVPGNHDNRLGPRVLQRAVREAGGAWLRSDPATVGGIRIEGRLRPRSALDGVTRILCAHHPSVTPAAQRAGFDLVLAGHLHGGQVVLFERAGRLYPYAWIDRWNGTRFELEHTTLIVSRGAGDVLPLRWRCPREVVLCAVG